MLSTDETALSHSPLPSEPGVIECDSEEAQQIHMEAERLACERRLAGLREKLDMLAAHKAKARDALERDGQQRLQRLASVGPTLRTPLHEVLGYARLLRMEGGLNDAQLHRVDAMLAAGMDLLDNVQAVLTLSEDGAPIIDAGDDERPVAASGLDTVAAGVPPAAAGASPVARHVLVVDDIAMNRDIAAAFLRAAGHLATLVESGAAAVQAVKSRHFDVVLMDVRMPEMDGLEATRLIRELNGAAGRVPIVALTAQAFVDQIADCRHAGMNGHLAKPFSPETLLYAVTRAAATAAPFAHAAASATSLAQTLALGATRPRQVSPVVSLNAFRRSPVDAALADARPTLPVWIDVDGPTARRPAAASMPGLAMSGVIAPGPAMPGLAVSRPAGPRRAPQDQDFVLRLAAVPTRGGRRLVDGKLSCAPDQARDQHEFHWLFFAGPVPQQQTVFTGRCDLWRWSGLAWRSVTVPGAHFSAEEMHDQGWRYCGPCVDRLARVEVLPPGQACSGGEDA